MIRDDGQVPCNHFIQTPAPFLSRDQVYLSERTHMTVSLFYDYMEMRVSWLVLQTNVGNSPMLKPFPSQERR